MTPVKNFKCFKPLALMKHAPIAILVIASFGSSMGVQAQSIVVASTTSTEQSGLFAHLLPEFKKASGIEVKVVALGTGQAIDMGRRGDADVLFVHDKVAEEKVVAEGFAVKRLEVMYNDFVLVGPAADPVKVTGNDVVEATTMDWAETPRDATSEVASSASFNTFFIQVLL